MIRKVILLAQGPNDVGFVRGLQRRLGCQAEMIDAKGDPGLRLRGQTMTARDVKRTITKLHKEGGDLLVRLTDADKRPPQEILKAEKGRFVEQGEQRVVVGVCDPDVEAWITADLDYAARILDFKLQEVPKDRVGRSGFIKSRIEQKAMERSLTETDFVEQFIIEVPSEVMKRWLSPHSGKAFRRFYDECVAAAQRADCPVQDERSLNGAGEGLSGPAS